VSDIDPKEFGRLQAQVDRLEADVAELRDDIKTLLELANKSKGGFWMGMTIASALGGVVTFVGERIIK
jgi:hypothetical protein